MPHVVIAGGGISGLAAAYRLIRDAPETDIILLERSRRLGGTIHTVREDGFVVEAGPDSFLASKPAGLRLCRELGIEDRLIRPIEANRGSFVLHDGRLHPIPEGLTGLVPSRLEPLLASQLFSPAGKERLAREPEMPSRADDADESLAAFVERRFGTEVYERLIEPLMAGIYAGDGTLLSLLATFPQLRDMEREHGSILRALGGRLPAQPSGPTGFLAPPGGMEDLVAALERQLTDVDIRCGETVQSIEPAGRGWSVRTDHGRHLADAVILALPAAEAARVLGDLDAGLAAPLASIPAASSALVSFAYREEDIEHPLHGYGYIIPRAEHRPALACTWVSSKWPGRVPPGFVLVRVFLGRYGQETALALPDSRLLQLARDELRLTLGITAAPVNCWLFRRPRAMPQYLIGHRQTVARIRSRLERFPGLYLAGNSYTGVGIPDCIQSGEDAAGAALAAHNLPE